TTRFYWLAGVSTHYNRDKVYDYPELPVPLDHEQLQEPTERWQSRRYYNFGAGIGMEMRWGPVGASLELPISARFKNVDGETEFDSIYPIPNFSIIYYIPKKD